ncbi:S-layer homology domain-containing protein [Desulfolucanica intricata]|uniref:S-layer homology domain-containing protein n=1 Tax=Desulfolucanica intricata TaxID=1285191 RepID=UPI000830601C|nr:S-layer homology domain-containing protein [Desulfolucanica intricata]
MKVSIRFFTLVILLGGVIGSISVGPGSILNAYQKDTVRYEKKYDYNGHWAEMYIDKAIVEGIVKGYPDGSFKPDEFISRAGFAGMLNKIIKDPGAAQNQSILTSFNDYHEVPEWAKTGLSKVISLGLLKGYSDNTIRPMTPLTREDIKDLISKEKLPTEVFKQKNSTFVTRAEACVIVLSIKDNGPWKNIVNNNPSDVSVKPLPEKKASNDVNVPIQRPPSNVYVPTTVPSSDDNGTTSEDGDIYNNNPLLPDDVDEDGSVSNNEEEPGADITSGTDPGVVITPRTSETPTLPDGNTNGGSMS